MAALVYVTLKPVCVDFGLDQDTVREDSETLLKTMSVAGLGPSEEEVTVIYILESIDFHCVNWVNYI